MDKNILIGNGINIQFSGNDDYKNYKIIERLIENIENNEYKDVFQNGITPKELLILIRYLDSYLNNKLKKDYKLKLARTDDERETLSNILERYSSKSDGITNIGLEDYFFLMKMVWYKRSGGKVPIKPLYDGLQWMFLDAIYNQGKIETLHEKMALFGKELKKYDKIFTVNYDTNLDKITTSRVYHLHGAFDVLNDTYNPNTIIGHFAQKEKSPPVVIQGKEYIYCNAIMGYSGNEKYKKIMSPIELNETLRNLQDMSRTDFESCIDGESQKNYDEETRNKFREMYINSEKRCNEYPFNEFETIKGELYILGMSPNNDSHLFSAINDNKDIQKIVYFSAGDEDTRAAKKVLNKPLEIRDVYKYWQSIGC